jgi:hypothetical protein
MRYCQTCGKPAKDDELLCPDPSCKGSLGPLRPQGKISEQEITRISDEVWTRTWKKHLGWIFGELSVLAVIGFIGVWAAYRSATVELSKLMVDKINSEFKTERIRATVSEVASNEARALLISEIQPEVTQFENEINTQINQVTLIANNAVSNLFSSMASDKIQGSETNRVIVFPESGFAVFLLKSVPIKNSIQAVFSEDNMGNRPLLPLLKHQRANTIGFFFKGAWDEGWKQATYVFQYVRDTSNTNIIGSIRYGGTNTIIVDGVPLRLPF